ncbi:MAG TPA: FAD-dependent oxidoreductase [Thermoanaerobaculaceae bacterium]|nr:FAD-dependent oxidoreductase [Thermoanaerobaculaceae bacterium]
MVGGVAAGMSAACRLRRLDEQASIVVLERGPHVSFANCGLPYHIGGAIRDRERLLVATPELLAARYALDVRVEHEVLAIDRPARQVLVRDLRAGKEYRLSYDRLDELPHDRELLVVCAVGQRGYVACRILSQRGFVCRNLSGGFALLQLWTRAERLRGDASAG